MFPNRGPFSTQAFFQQVPLKGSSLGRVWSGDVSYAGDQICKIAEAFQTGGSGPRESELYQQEFARFYERIAPVSWKEAELSEYIARMCPQHVKTFNLMRSTWMQRRAGRRNPVLPPPLPPPGPPVASVDRYPLMTPPPPPPPPPPPLTDVPSVDTSTSSVPPPPPPPPPPAPTGMVTPSTFDQVQTQTAQDQPCPPGQFPAYPGGPCRGAVATGMMRPGGGGLPMLPGGLFDSASVTNLTPGGGYGGFAGLAGRIPVVNIQGRRT